MAEVRKTPEFTVERYGRLADLNSGFEERSRISGRRDIISISTAPIVYHERNYHEPNH